MKKSVKIALIASALLILAGIICVFVAIYSSDFSFRKLYSTEYTMETVTIENCQNLSDISLAEDFLDISVIVSEDGACRIEYPAIVNMNRSYYLDEEGKTLVNSITDNRQWFDLINVFSVNEPCIKIYLPEKEYRDFKLETTSGDITLENTLNCDEYVVKSHSGDIRFGQQNFSSASLTSTSGDVYCNGVKSGSVNINTTSGDVYCKNSEPNILTIVTTSGEAHLNNIDASLGVKAITTSGDIDAYNLISDSFIRFKTTSGDVEFSYVNISSYINNEDESIGITIETVSGDVDGHFKTTKNLNVSTTSGNINIPPYLDDNNKGVPCNITTVSGDINVRTSYYN